MKKLRTALWMMLLLGICLGGSGLVWGAPIPPNPDLTVNVKTSMGTPIVNAAVKYTWTGSPGIYPLGNTDVNGQVIIPNMAQGTYQIWVQYASSKSPSQIATYLNPPGPPQVLNFQTTKTSILVEDSDHNPINGATIIYGSGSWYTYGTTGPNGKAYKELFADVSNLNFYAKYNWTSSPVQSTIVSAADPMLTFTTTTVNFRFSGATLLNSSGLHGFTSPIELFEGTWNFRFEIGPYNDKKIFYMDIPISGPAVNKTIAMLRLLDHVGSPLIGGTARGGSTTPTQWHVSGSTNAAGLLLDCRDGLLSSLAYEMKFNNTVAIKGPQDPAIDSYFEFQTILLTLRLETCGANPLDGGKARYGMGSTYTSWWFPGGDTGSSAPGETQAEFFPGTYSFEMQYQATAQTMLNVVVPAADTKLTWQTSTVKIHYGNTISYGGPAGDSKYLGNSEELLPGTYWFNFRDSINGDVRRQITIKPCSYEKTAAIVRVKTSGGVGRPDYSGVWYVAGPQFDHDWGPTDAEGVYLILVHGLPQQETTVCLNYGSKTDSLSQWADSDSIYIFVPQNTLMVSTTSGGTVDDPGVGSYVYDHNTPVDLDGTPDPHYHFVEWTGTAVDAGKVTDPCVLDTSVFVDDDYTLVANFTIDQHTLEISSTDGGDVNDPGEGPFVYDYNTPVHLLAENDPHYHFVEWTGTAVDANKVADPCDPNTSVLVDADYTLVAHFEIDVHNIHLSSSAGGHVTNLGEGDFWVDYGTVIQLTTEIDDPLFAFSSWRGTLAGRPSPYLLTVTRDYDIRAIFQSALDVLYVDDNAPNDVGPFDMDISDPCENGTVGHPFDSVQEAIEVAKPGATVVVLAGTYDESLFFSDKQICVTSTDPDANEPVLEYPVIQAAEGEPVVKFQFCSDPNMVLEGLILTGGNDNDASGIRCLDSDVVVKNCLIVGNRRLNDGSPAGGALWCSNSQVTLSNCTLTQNYGGISGAGIYAAVDSDITVLDSILWDNLPMETLADENSIITIMTGDVAGGYPGAGNLDVDPIFVAPGHWEHALNPGMVVLPSHFYAVWVAGDYHLTEGSPCVDAGDPLSDYSQEPEPNGARVNMGAYGNTPQATMTPIP